MADIDTQTHDAPPSSTDAEAEVRRHDIARAEESSRRAARPWVRLGMIVALVLLVGGGIWYWLSSRNTESTDDAYTDGRAVTIAPHVTGYVVSLDVNDNQFVHAGDPLVHIDPRDYQAALEQAQGQAAAAAGQLAAASRGYEVAQANFPARLLQARAQVSEAEANLTKAQADERRQLAISRAATTQQQIDTATAARRSAEAQLSSAQAGLAQASPVKPNVAQVGAQVSQLGGLQMQAAAALRLAQLNLEWCVVRAPQDGWMTRRNVEQGNFVQPGQQIFAIVSPDIWITANFKENQLDRVRPGQKVKITVDAYPSLDLTGHVDSIQLGSGSKFTAFPPENATGNYVKIVQRVPVKIVIDSGLDPRLPLPLGISVSPSVSLK